MYTAYIGRRLVDLINARDKTSRTVRQFFDEVYFPLFFDSDRYLQHVNNSKFDQAYKQKGKTPLSALVRADVLLAQHARIQNDAPDGSFFLGGAAAEATAGTSGQVTDIKLPITPDEVYASWIGAALGIGVSGGLNLLADADEVLLALFDGWQQYRAYMNATPTLKPHQINTWNGWWLTVSFARQFDLSRPFAVRQPDVKTDKTTGIASLETQKWVNVTFALARKLPHLNSLTTYVYSLSQMNTTVGFILINLPQIVRVERDLYRQLFALQGDFREDALDNLYNTELGFQKACELGAIGIKALEPASLREYMPGARGPGKPFKVPKDNNDPIQITYAIYQTWIIAMLNNQELLNLTQRIATVLTQAGADMSQRGKKVNRNAVADILESGQRKQLIERMAAFVESSPEQAALFDEIGDTIIRMPTTDFPLFMALLKLKYAVAQAKS
jgi:hypothetical protein